MPVIELNLYLNLVADYESGSKRRQGVIVLYINGVHIETFKTDEKRFMAFYKQLKDKTNVYSLRVTENEKETIIRCEGSKAWDFWHYCLFYAFRDVFYGTPNYERMMALYSPRWGKRLLLVLK